MVDSLRLAHISDLHLYTLDLSPWQFFSKRCLGNANQIFLRGNTFPLERQQALLTTLLEEKISHVLVTGDVSTTSHPKEFAKAKRFLDQIKALGIKVYLIPGNHDNYTRKAYNSKRFYKVFGKDASFFPIELSQDQVASIQLNDDWWLVLMDTTYAAPFRESNGNFSPSIESKLCEVLEKLPQNAKIMLANHFPLYDQDGKGHGLKGSENLISLLKKHPAIRFYVHGHTHRHTFADLRPNQLPIILDSGSTAHKSTAFWQIVDIKQDGGEVRVFSWDKEIEKWISSKASNWVW